MFSSKFNYIHWRMLTVCFKEYFAMPSTPFNQKVGWKIQDANAPARFDDGSSDGRDWVMWWENLINAGKMLGRPFGTESLNYKS
jgi:hypothetical protein